MLDIWSLFFKSTRPWSLRNFLSGPHCFLFNRESHNRPILSTIAPAEVAVTARLRLCRTWQTSRKVWQDSNTIVPFLNESNTQQLAGPWTSYFCRWSSSLIGSNWSEICGLSVRLNAHIGTQHRRFGTRQTVFAHLWGYIKWTWNEWDSKIK